MHLKQVYHSSDLCKCVHHAVELLTYKISFTTYKQDSSQFDMHHEKSRTLWQMNKLHKGGNVVDNQRNQLLTSLTLSIM